MANLMLKITLKMVFIRSLTAQLKLKNQIIIYLIAKQSYYPEKECISFRNITKVNLIFINVLMH